MNSTATPPLVSIVVRTMGKPAFQRALASIAAQTHRPLEIVVVDATGGGLALAKHADIPVRTVSKVKLARPHAANAGMGASRGAWILFLDEDDEIEPGHVAQLLATAAAASLPVAYNGGPFDRAALKRSSYLAIHSVIFHRSIIDAGLRFDESLASLEDWNFWLKLAERSDFASTGQAPAK